MANPASAPPPAPPTPPIQTKRSRKPQFSLRSMMVATTAFAVVAALSTLIGVETILSIVIGLGAMLMAPTALGVFVYYSRGRRQTFFAGALVGSLAPHILFRGQFGATGDVWQSLLFLTALAIAILACGFTALYARRIVERSGWDRPPRGE